MTREEFIVGAEERLSYLLQQFEREVQVRNNGDPDGALLDAQIKLAQGKCELITFIADAILPEALSGGARQLGREPKAINSESRL